MTAILIVEDISSYYTVVLLAHRDFKHNDTLGFAATWSF